jgi:hypothetical protein
MRLPLDVYQPPAARAPATVSAAHRNQLRAVSWDAKVVIDYDH